jgi:hypothetical protein
VADESGAALNLGSKMGGLENPHIRSNGKEKEKDNENPVRG